jgi:hypothetical protein
MKIINSFISISLFILCLVGVSEASQSCNDVLIVNNANQCLVDKMITHEKGVVLLVNNFWIGAQGVQATEAGILVLENGEWMPLSEAIKCDDYFTWQCRKCKAWNPQGSNRCMKCLSPRG